MTKAARPIAQPNVQGVQVESDDAHQKGGQVDPGEPVQLFAKQLQAGFRPAEMRGRQSVRYADHAQGPQREELCRAGDQRRADGARELGGLERHRELPTCDRKCQRQYHRHDQGQREGLKTIDEAIGRGLANPVAHGLDHPDQAAPPPQQGAQRQGEQHECRRVCRLVAEHAPDLEPAAGRNDPPHLLGQGPQLLQLGLRGAAHPQQMFVEEGVIGFDRFQKPLLDRFQLAELTKIIIVGLDGLFQQRLALHRKLAELLVQHGLFCGGRRPRYPGYIGFGIAQSFLLPPVAKTPQTDLRGPVFAILGLAAERSQVG